MVKGVFIVWYLVMATMLATRKTLLCLAIGSAGKGLVTVPRIAPSTAMVGDWY